MRTRWLTIALLVLTASTSLAQADLQKWRKDYATELAQPNGWLALVALEWLQEGDTSIGSAPDNKIKLLHTPAHLGLMRLHSNHIEFLAPPEGIPSGVLVDGKPAAGGIFAADDAPHPSEIVTGGVRMTVIHRGQKFYLRVKDEQAPSRVNFAGLKWYPFASGYTVTAKWVPYAPAKPIKIMNVLGQLTPATTPGYAEFVIDGKTVRLEPIAADKDGMFFVFRDTTSKTTTDGAGRFLDTPAPSNGVSAAGTVVLDFNRAHNPPCGYTPYATCPLPTEDNRLAVPIPAGEKRYGSE